MTHLFEGTAECDPLECNVVGKKCDGDELSYEIVDTELKCAVNSVRNVK